MRLTSFSGRIAAIALLSVAVLACSTATPEPRPMPSLAYQKYPAIRLNVAQIQVVDNYTASGQPPYIEGQMAAPLPQVVHDWAASRFQARGQDGTLVITIDKAFVMSDNMKRTNGLRGLMTIDQAQKLSGQVEVKFAVTNVSFGNPGNATVGAKGMRTVPENASLQQQDILLANLTEDLITELDAGTQRVFSDKLPTLMQQGGLAPGMTPSNMAPSNMAPAPMAAPMNQGTMPATGSNF